MMFRNLSTVMVLVLTAPSWGADAVWPIVQEVDRQPLLAQVKRLDSAMTNLGQPFPETTKTILTSLMADDANGPAQIQALIDPLCVVAVEIGKQGVERVIPQPGKHELIEKGWRISLVKVVNRSGATGMLRAESPNARPVPGGPKDDVAKRWLSLLPYSGQPLLPNLSGLSLEYTVLQLYSRDAGQLAADISFRVEGGKNVDLGKGPTIREWKFSKDTDGWLAEKNCKLEATRGTLSIAMTGEDPYISTPITAGKGRFVLRFWAKFSQDGYGQVFWRTKSQAQVASNQLRNFKIEANRAMEYEVRFATDEDLASIRFDPGNDPGSATVDWINLSYEVDPKINNASAQVAFEAKPSIPVSFQVSEFDGTPTMAAFLIRDASGRVYPAQAKRLAPDFFFQQQIYRSTGETVHLPNGRYTVVCSRGPESIPETKELIVDGKPTQLKYVVNRWIDPSKTNWFSGDHHIHAAGCLHYDNPTEGVEPSDMMRHVLGEDLKVGCCLTWGPCFDYQKRFFTGRPDDVSKYPYLLRYDVEVSGFGSHASGHLNLLRLKEQIFPGGNSKTHWPTLGMNTLRWAKKQGAVTGPAHSGNGLTRFVGRIEGAKDGPGNLPNFNIPAYDGIGANEFIVDATHEVPGPNGKLVPALDFISTMDTDRTAEWNMWYHVLNCGFRIRASGETDFPCISGERVGMGRVYAKVDGKLDFDQWVQALADGRSYISDGTTHLMDFTATVGDKVTELGTKGSEIELSKEAEVTFTVKAARWLKSGQAGQIELIVNGFPVAKEALPADGKVRDFSFKATIPNSSWVAIRVTPSAHTNPFFVIVGNQPIRASKQSAEWCLAGVEQCWKTKKNTYKGEEQQQAVADYDHARKVYRQIIAENTK